MTDAEKIQEYEEILGVNGKDIAKKAFLALCKVAKAQTKRLEIFNLDKEIAVNPKDDKIYDRTMGIVDSMPKMIKDIKSLREELGIKQKEIEEAFIDGIAEKRL